MKKFISAIALMAATVSLTGCSVFEDSLTDKEEKIASVDLKQRVGGLERYGVTVAVSNDWTKQKDCKGGKVFLCYGSEEGHRISVHLYDVDNDIEPLLKDMSAPFVTLEPEGVPVEVREKTSGENISLVATKAITHPDAKKGNFFYIFEYVYPATTEKAVAIEEFGDIVNTTHWITDIEYREQYNKKNAEPLNPAGESD